jgi:hypothetical protein
MPGAIQPFYKLMDHFARTGGIGGDAHRRYQKQWAALGRKMERLWR